MITHIIFDFDGTLADTFELVRETAKKEFEGITDYDFELVRKEGIRGLLREKSIPAGKLPGFVSKMTTAMKKRKDLKLMPGISEVVRQLNQKYKVGILSSNSEENIVEALNREGLSGIFDFIYSDSSIFGKHFVMNRMCKKHRLDPCRIVYVGDEDRDIIAAQKANIRNIAVTWGFNSEERLRMVGPDHLARTPGEIISFLN